MVGPDKEPACLALLSIPGTREDVCKGPGARGPHPFYSVPLAQLPGQSGPTFYTPAPLSSPLLVPIGM